MSTIKIEFNQPGDQINILDARTGELLLGVDAIHLLATPRGMEAHLIVDDPIVEGNCTIPVTEQMVISREFISLLAKLVAKEFQKSEIDDERFQQTFEQLNAIDRVKYEIATELTQSVERSLLRKLRTLGVIS